MLKEFESRRNKLANKIGDDSAAVLFSAEEGRFGGGLSYPYLQNSDFYYLTGFVEPESIAVLVPGIKSAEFILFNRERDYEKEIWCGQYAGQEGVCSDFGANKSFPISRVDEILPEILSGKEKIHSNVDLYDPRYRKLENWINISNPNISSEIYDLGNILHMMRLRKSEREIEIIREAIEITTKGHLRAMERCRPGIYEYELEAELLYEFNRGGASVPSFEVIVASGENACTLHYSRKMKKMGSGELVLVDAGIKHGYYCTDVTRTFPVDKFFTKEQQAIYNVVLEAQKRVIFEIRPGIFWSHLQSIAERIITEGLVDIGILKGNIDSLLEQGKFKQFFMHKIGHWLGIDTHDVGGYFEDEKSRVLRPNMVFTVEPGVYISPDIIGVGDKWKGIGVRVEDNLLVTENGGEILTKKIPKEVSDIEKIRSGIK